MVSIDSERTNESRAFDSCDGFVVVIEFTQVLLFAIRASSLWILKAAKKFAQVAGLSGYIVPALWKFRPPMFHSAIYINLSSSQPLIKLVVTVTFVVFHIQDPCFFSIRLCPNKSHYSHFSVIILTFQAIPALVTSTRPHGSKQSTPISISGWIASMNTCLAELAKWRHTPRRLIPTHPANQKPKQLKLTVRNWTKIRAIGGLLVQKVLEKDRVSGGKSSNWVYGSHNLYIEQSSIVQTWMEGIPFSKFWTKLTMCQ